MTDLVKAVANGGEMVAWLAVDDADADVESIERALRLLTGLHGLLRANPRAAWEMSQDN